MLIGFHSRDASWLGLGPPHTVELSLVALYGIDTGTDFRTLFYFNVSFVVEALPLGKVDSLGREEIIPFLKITNKRP